MTPAPRRLLKAILLATVMAAVTSGFTVAAQTDAGLAELRDELRARRARLADKLGAGSMAILWSAPARVYSRDVDYDARQDSDLLYLTGVDQPETILVLLPGSPRRSEILFITPSNPRQEHYVGKFLTAAEARARTGIETVLLTTQFDQFLTAMFNRRPFDLAVDEARINTDHDVFFKALDEGTARGGAAARGHTGRDERTVERRVRVRQPRPRTAARRPHHQPCAARACTAAGEDADTNRSCWPKASRSPQTRILPACGRRDRSASSGRSNRRSKRLPGARRDVSRISSIVGSGPNATTLHYSASSRQMNEGDLLLVDAAANYRGQTGDITRTYPVSGRFTPEQREIYALVLAAQDAGMKAARRSEPGHRARVRGGHQGGAAQARPDHRRDRTAVPHVVLHGILHWIGMDMHDVGDYKRPLEAGMAFVIEPGIYIRPEALEQLADTPENLAFGEGRSRAQEVCGHRRPHRRLVPADRQRARPPVRQGAAHAPGDR